jgi:hypothetical protein
MNNVSRRGRVIAGVVLILSIVGVGFVAAYAPSPDPLPLPMPLAGVPVRVMVMGPDPITGGQISYAFVLLDSATNEDLDVNLTIVGESPADVWLNERDYVTVMKGEQVAFFTVETSKITAENAYLELEASTTNTKKDKLIIEP